MNTRDEILRPRLDNDQRLDHDENGNEDAHDPGSAGKGRAPPICKYANLGGP
jgi:hypothetical protein